MTRILDEIRARVGAEYLTDCCSRDGCDVSMNDVPPERVIVDADLAFPAHELHGERCDFIVFASNGDENLRAVPLELKSGGTDLTKAHRQLNKGAKFIDRVGPIDPSPVCRPLLIHGRSLTPHERKRLNRLKVAFRGLQLTIKTARCGSPGNLALALEI